MIVLGVQQDDSPSWLVLFIPGLLGCSLFWNLICLYLPSTSGSIKIPTSLWPESRMISEAWMEHLFLWTIGSVGGMYPLWKNSALHNTLFTFLWPILKVSMVSICSAITPLLSIKTPFLGSGFSLSHLHSSVWNLLHCHHFTEILRGMFIGRTGIGWQHVSMVIKPSECLLAVVEGEKSHFQLQLLAQISCFILSLYITYLWHYKWMRFVLLSSVKRWEVG